MQWLKSTAAIIQRSLCLTQKPTWQFFCGVSHDSVLTSNGRVLAPGPQWLSMCQTQGETGRQPGLAASSRLIPESLEAWGGTQINVLCEASLWQAPTHTHTRLCTTHTWINSLIQTCALCFSTHAGVSIRVCTIMRPFTSYRITSHPSHAGSCAPCLVACEYSVLLEPARSSSAVRWVYLCGAVILRHRLRAVVCVCSLQRSACSLMSVWLTSSLAQISIKAPADEAAADGCCVLGCLVCLSGSVKYLLIREKGRPCSPAGWTLPRTAFAI